jgi:ribonuclease/clavin/mitogillin
VVCPTTGSATDLAPSPVRYITLDNNLQLTTGESRAFLERIGLSGVIVSTPGHSDDSVTLVLDEGGAFTGDLPPETAAVAEALDTVRQSWNMIRSLGARTIYPGHGPVRPLPPAAG